MKGRTRWFPRHVHPVRPGLYECFVRLAGGARTVWDMQWDGVGFIAPIPLVVLQWRGMTKAAHRAASKGGAA